MDEGGYGRCANCGQNIAVPRLEALPWARFCVDCQELAEKGLLNSASDLSDGGCAIAFAKACFQRELGIQVSMRLDSNDSFALTERLFSEIGSSVIATADPARVEEIQAVLRERAGVWVTALKAAWSGAMESQLADEVVTA